MAFKGLPVVIPHSGLLIPSEIPLDTLSRDFPRLMRNVDWYTNWLYDFRDILGNSHLSFPYCSLILEANRHPENLTESVPLKDTFGDQVYRTGLEPGLKLRQSLSQKYLTWFHQAISTEITHGKTFINDGHSTVTVRGMADNQIELMNFQNSGLNKEPTYFCPDLLIDTYANELSKKLSWVRVTLNESRYDNVYGHVCCEYSVNA